MKSKNKYLPIVMALMASAINLLSQGYIVTNGVIKFSGYSGPGIAIDVLANPPVLPPDTAYYTGFILAPRNGNTYLYGAVATVDIRTFFVSLNDPLTSDAIQAGNYTELISGNDYVFHNGVAFYVGVYTGHGSPTPGVFSDPIFGWAALVNNNGQMELLDGAMEYKGAGIYAGTMDIIQPVPEPGTLGLISLGGLFLVLSSRQVR